MVIPLQRGHFEIITADVKYLAILAKLDAAVTEGS